MALLIDDFTTGAESFEVPPVTTEIRYQAGSMMGGARLTSVNNAASPKGIPARVDIGSASHLSLTLGAVQYARLEVGYGWQADGTQTPLRTNLHADGAERFVTTFAAEDRDFLANFNVVVFAAGGWSSAGANVTAGPVEFAFADFVGPGEQDFSDVSFIYYVFQTSDDLAIDRFETI